MERACRSHWMTRRQQTYWKPWRAITSSKTSPRIVNELCGNRIQRKVPLSRLVREWTTEDVCRWLESIGLAEFSSGFETNQICGQSICMLKEEELEHAIGMKALGKRKIFQKYQEMLKKYYNKKLSQEAKSFIMKRSRQIRGEKNLQNLKQGQPNYLSIREEDESASSAKNSLNSLNSSTRINGMDKFMLLEEEDYQENKGKIGQPEKKKNADDNNDQHRSNDYEDNILYEKPSRYNIPDRSPKDEGQTESSPLQKKKKKQKQKHQHRDQGEYGSSSDPKSDTPDYEPMLKNHSKSRDNVASAPSSKEDLGGAIKLKRKNSPSLNYLPQDEEHDTEALFGPKDTFRHFADDEDEEMHTQLKNQKQKSAKQAIHKVHSAGSFNPGGDTQFNKSKPPGISSNVFSEDKLFQQNPAELKERQLSKHDSCKISSSPKKQSEITEPQEQDQNNLMLGSQTVDKQAQEIVQVFQQQNYQEQLEQANQVRQKKEKSQNGGIIQETQSLDIKPSRKDENGSSVSEQDTLDHRAKSDDNGSVSQHNTPDYLKNKDLSSLKPDFVLSKPIILNFNTNQAQAFSTETQSTLQKLGIQKDNSQVEKSESMKSTGSYALGPQTSASSNGDINNTTNTGIVKLLSSGATHNNQNSANIPGQHNIVDSSSTSSDESSDEQNKPTAQTKRSKGDGGASVSSDSDQNSKPKQRYTPQQKYKKDPSAKESREPSKERANNNNNNQNNNPQVKMKQKKVKDVVEIDKVKSRRDEREQQLEQLLRDMGINKKLIIDYTELEFGKKIGEGSYGQVFKGEWQRTDVAIKQFGKKNSKFHLRKVQDFISEVRVMNNLRHPNIVLYMGVCLYQSQYFMITEYLKEGSLFDHLHKHKTNFSETNLITMIEDMALGMVYLHGRKVMHCDLKSSNVLIDENWNVKLCDFGLSRIKSTLHKKKDERKAEGLVGTPQWMAPEIMRREQYQEHSDVYSFGMIMWELITKKIPYKGLSHQQIYGTVGYDNNYQVEIPKRGIPRYLNLMRKCLIREPSQRPTFQEIVDEVQLMKTDLKDNNKKQVVKEIIRFFD